MTKDEQIALYFGSPMPSWYSYQPSIIEYLFGKVTLKDLKKQWKKYKEEVKNWEIRRISELKEVI